MVHSVIWCLEVYALSTTSILSFKRSVTFFLLDNISHKLRRTLVRPFFLRQTLLDRIFCWLRKSYTLYSTAVNVSVACFLAIQCTIWIFKDLWSFKPQIFDLVPLCIKKYIQKPFHLVCRICLIYTTITISNIHLCNPYNVTALCCYWRAVFIVEIIFRLIDEEAISKVFQGFPYKRKLTPSNA